MYKRNYDCTPLSKAPFSCGTSQQCAGLTTSVENTKSSSLRPQLGRELMSPITDAPTPMICNQRVCAR